MPRCLWCDAPNPVLNKNISPLPLQKHEVNKFSSLESRHSANNSLENKVHRNKRKLFFFSPLIFILIVLGLFLFFYTTATPFDVSVVLFLICSFLAFMFLLSPFFSEPNGNSFNAPVDDWYTPESTPSLTKVADNIWMLEITFNEHILYSGQDVFSGNIGIHLEDWNEFDKSLLGLVVVDENGEILWGTPWDGSGIIHNQEYANVQK